MSSVNEVTLIGNLGADPESRNGGAVSVRLATSWKTKEGEEKTDWHRVTCFGKTGESVAKYLKKGAKVYVKARLSYSQYEKDGKPVYSTDLIAERVIFLDGKKGPEEPF